MIHYSVATAPSYIKLHEEGVLANRAAELYELYRECTLCPRNCRVDRTLGETGICRASFRLKVSHAFPHFGEEAPLVGSRGSGTIFFSNCGLRCIYCQNHDISIDGCGEEITDRRLAELMIALQGKGCHNINLVTPTHYLPGILNAVDIASAMGLELPLVYNTSGYEKPEIVRYLEGVADIFMPDFKYWDPAKAARYSSGAEDYPEYARSALQEMHRQAGDLEMDGEGIARRGLLIRHLVLPNGIAGSREVLRFISGEISAESYVNIMAQYRPEHEAWGLPEIARRLDPDEFKEVLRWALDSGLTRLDGFEVEE